MRSAELRSMTSGTDVEPVLHADSFIAFAAVGSAGRSASPTFPPHANGSAAKIEAPTTPSHFLLVMG